MVPSKLAAGCFVLPAAVRDATDTLSVVSGPARRAGPADHGRCGLWVRAQTFSAATTPCRFNRSMRSSLPLAAQAR